MLLKPPNSTDRKVFISSKGNGGGGGVVRGTAMRMTVATSSTMTPRIHRKGFRTPSKRHPGKVLPGKLHSISRVGPGKLVPGKRINPRPHPPPCDNSNDSGFGFDQHVEIQNNNNNNNNNNNSNNNNINSNNNNHHQHHHTPQQQIIRTIPTSRCIQLEDDDVDNDDNNDHDDDEHEHEIDDHLIDNNNDDENNDDNRNYLKQIRTKRRKIEDIQIDNDDACSNDAFIQKIATTAATGITATTTTLPSSLSSTINNINNTTSCTATKFLSSSGRSNVRAALKRPTIPVQSNISTSSKNGSVQLQIISQPEQQHRARYQTEGSRGAVKDRSGNGFPIVKLIGYNKPAVLQVFIGTDIGRVAPHMFYQACKVAGKNSTPCNEKKVDGTMIIEIEFKPENDMTITCDCVGILKERNVDVEHRFPDHSGQRSKKKSTRCRMVFRTQLTHDDGTLETLQVCSYPIICTQPPGVPEICKKSLNSCPVDGGLELFIIGKNFLKDTCVVFRDGSDTISQNDMARLQNSVWEQTVLPDKEYLQQTHLVCTVPPYIHQNILEPVSIHLFVMSSGKRSETQTFVYTPKGAHSILSAATTLSTLHGTINGGQQDSRFTDNTAPSSVVLWGPNVPMEPKHEIDSGMMPPPASLPLSVGRRPSISNSTMITAATVAAATNAINAAEQLSPIGLKTEIMDDNSQSSMPDAMQTDSPLDQFSAQVQNDTAVAASAVNVSSTNPIQQHIRKQTIDIIDMHPMSMLNDASNMSNFSTNRSVVDMHSVKQEQLKSQIQSHIFSAAAVAQAAQAVQAVQAAQAAQAVQAAQDQQTVNKFLSSLDANMTELKPNVVDTGTVNPLFMNAPTNNPNSNGIFSQPPSMGSLSMMSAAASANIEQTFPQSILSNGSPSTNVNQIMSMPPSDSPNAVCSPSSNSSSSASIHSPITQDIILNSEPAASIQSANMQMIQPQASNTASADHITSELILNPTVSPSMMCSSSSDPSNLIVNPVTMANTILNEMTLAAAASQNTQENILNNIMMNSHPPSNQMDNSHKNPSEVTVNNMILKAAADFITNQERGAISTESTLNALMSLNSTPILNDSQSTVSQILNNIPSNPSQSTSASSPVLTGTEPPCSNSTTCSQTRLEIMPTTQPPSSTMSRHLSHFNDQNVITSHQNSLSSVRLENLLLNQNVSGPAIDQNEYLHNLQKTSSVTSSGNQESLLQTVSLARTTLEKSKIDGAVEQLSNLSQSVNLNQTNATQSSTTTTIPQEITTMSDQDLISYINPSCFDQV